MGIRATQCMLIPSKKPPKWKDAGRRCFCRAAFEWQKARSHQMEETGEEDWKCPIIRWVHLENLRETAIFTSKFYRFPWMLRVASFRLDFLGSRVGHIWSGFLQAPQGCASCMDPQLGRSMQIYADLWFTDDTGKSKSKKDRSWNYSSGCLWVFAFPTFFLRFL